MACRGVVLNCLTKTPDMITSEDCKAEVLRFVKMEVDDVFRYDVPLSDACWQDIERVLQEFTAR
jgi:hypothetical protein